jgi:hypothetical protein
MVTYSFVEPEKGHEHISPESIIQRPKVLYSEETGKYHVRPPHQPIKTPAN